MNDKVREAIIVLNQGGIVIYPTDTAFGIGCRVDDTDAIKRLFKLRKRPSIQPTPVLIDSIAMAREYFVNISRDVRDRLMNQYWPGALTIVLPCKVAKVPTLVRGGEESIGLRIPNHEIAIEIIQGCHVPILGPSANFHGEKTPYELFELDQELIKLVDYVVPGECKVKQASTVIDCSVKPWKILREGAVQLANSI